MADEKTTRDEVKTPEDNSDRVEASLAVEPEIPGVDDGEAPAQLGSAKYVHAAFFAAGILFAFLCGKILFTAWNLLAEWPAAVRSVPQLLQYSEDERPTYTTAAGALIAIVTVVQVYRKETTRQWADEVATELSKVVWPDKETVTNGTIVVIVASMIATVYIGLLDRFWGFVTTLVYGA